jgi:hypothetical protein
MALDELGAKIAEKPDDFTIYPILFPKSEIFSTEIAYFSSVSLRS